MNPIHLFAMALVAVTCSPVPAAAQAVTGTTQPPPVPVSELEQRVAALEAELARQTLIASNARQSLDALRAEVKLKDELLVLGRERNAELYAIAMEIAKKHVRSDDWEPFFQGERVKMENLRQSYEDRLRAARVYESTLPPSVQKQMDAELGTAPTEAPKTPAADQN
ncbi:hypothetical protein [Sphingomonas sp. 37zxx]|uniref:hypothetical protein n=1 Tax=Sphingomonas sp. 37zxx TaxID=1550073 RepID=UPI000AE521C0|nr:hypothetical protein [Sphingomonas sp. 37zxx]